VILLGLPRPWMCHALRVLSARAVSEIAPRSDSQADDDSDENDDLEGAAQQPGAERGSARDAGATPHGLAATVLALSLIVVSIGLVDSLNPGTIASALYFATSSQPVRTTLAFGAGVLLVNLLAGIALLFGVGRLVYGVVPHPGADAKQRAELVLGGARLWARSGSGACANGYAP
jgi:hypothetical protein